VVSEDLQSDPLQALVVLDFQGFVSTPTSNVIGQGPVPPGHLNVPEALARDAPPISFSFPPGITPGCHTVTLMVSHKFIIDLGTQHFAPNDPKDIATATWLYDLDKQCALPPTLESDAGAEGGDL
jgi:hypothetical protein